MTKSLFLGRLRTQIREGNKRRIKEMDEVIDFGVFGRVRRVCRWEIKCF
jgi:hypothetical protein